MNKDIGKCNLTKNLFFYIFVLFFIIEKTIYLGYTNNDNELHQSSAGTSKEGIPRRNTASFYTKPTCFIFL